MNKNTIILLSIIVVACNLWSSAKAKTVKTLRVGGSYILEKVERKSDNEFVVQFKSVSPSGKFDTLVLHTSHVHYAVKQGDKLRLSAEVVAESGAKAEITQVLLFLPAREGLTPVWLLSNRFKHDSLEGADYLKMHAPQSDYQVL